MSNEDSVPLKASCLCNEHVFTASVPKSKLPLQISACHCTSCRRVSGALYTTDIEWPVPGSQVDVHSLKKFEFSKKVAVFFCGTCGTDMFWGHPHDRNEDLLAFSGTLENVNEDLIKLTHHIFVGDTVDGGATPWLLHPNADGSEAKRYETRPTGDNVVELPKDWPPSSSLTGYESRVQDTIPVQCKCKGVNLTLQKGDYTNVKKEDLPAIIDPKTHKLEASLCACDSCRLFGGIDVFPWTYAELRHISSTSSAQSLPTNIAGLRAAVDKKDGQFGTLTYFASSPPVQRYFCGRCGAKIFYATDKRPNIVDVAVGVLDAKDGARAEGFLSWNFDEVEAREDGKGGWREGHYERMEKAVVAFREERGYPKFWKKQ
ncbi:hypothetical protein BU24DRAFT_418810 [Aaosphaeria arxii CBS 175.79]|uniref:CENP-V/GFA domain-containing protein n=1 Tax=Aaosphaeria arxii CBS 175.79 TaxID=1450172 RepID=A0A6A5Y1X7_9PLEO|nr:uncharacterized protein BU24DRAFT_418810 [Aaosphaeria arxii CBS 175.79]KAF2019213.1 hypothetical protein BU24DRAFT_418810 [Aaosphaeria arxii CBS 175.79]